MKGTLTRKGERTAPGSPLRPDVMNPIETITAQMWPGVPVIPTMGVSTTDSRHFREAGIPMYGVSGLFVDPADPLTAAAQTAAELSEADVPARRAERRAAMRLNASQCCSTKPSP